MQMVEAAPPGQYYSVASAPYIVDLVLTTRRLVRFKVEAAP
jgi:hypothetical protein